MKTALPLVFLAILSPAKLPDDLAAILIIALFYTEDLELVPLGLAAAGIGTIGLIDDDVVAKIRDEVGRLVDPVGERTSGQLGPESTVEVIPSDEGPAAVGRDPALHLLVARLVDDAHPAAADGAQHLVAPQALDVAAGLLCRSGDRTPDCADCRRVARREHPDLLVAAPESGRRANTPPFDETSGSKETTIPTALVRALAQRIATPSSRRRAMARTIRSTLL